MTEDLVKKIKKEIESGITRESQVVYILSGIRKLIEQLDEPQTFSSLKFYCDWALHSRMSGTPAQKVLKVLELVYKCMAEGKRAPQHSEAMLLIRFDLLKDELSALLNRFGLKNFTESTNSWVIFVYLFSKVVQDCPLEIRLNAPSDIEEIFIQVETAKELIDDHLPYKVNWIFHAKGELPPAKYYIHNTYSVSEFGIL